MSRLHSKEEHRSCRQQAIRGKREGFAAELLAVTTTSCTATLAAAVRRLWGKPVIQSLARQEDHDQRDRLACLPRNST